MDWKRAVLVVLRPSITFKGANDLVEALTSSIPISSRELHLLVERAQYGTVANGTFTAELHAVEAPRLVSEAAQETPSSWGMKSPGAPPEPTPAEWQAQSSFRAQLMELMPALSDQQRHVLTTMFISHLMSFNRRNQ
jgi:hypothetical protein